MKSGSKGSDNIANIIQGAVAFYVAEEMVSTFVEEYRKRELDKKVIRKEVAKEIFEALEMHTNIFEDKEYGKIKKRFTR